MRNLQRLSHLRPVPADAVQEVRRAERRDVSRRERWIWKRRLRTLLLVAALSAPFAIGAYVFKSLGLVTHALVVTEPTVARAPALVRVAEVLCEPGQRVARGDALVRLEPVGPDAERGTLVARADAERLRLELFDAGGHVDVTGRTEERDLAYEAAREVQLATADLEVLGARLTGLERRRATAEVARREEEREHTGKLAELDERLAAARAALEVARTSVPPAEFDAESSERLRTDGIVSDRVVEGRRAEREAARFEVTERTATARALEREIETTAALSALARERTAATLAELDAQIATAEREIAAAERRTALWREAEEHYRARREAGLPVVEQRRFERRLLEAQIAAAEAALAAHDEVRGGVVLRAEQQGVVDRIAVEPGAVVDAGTVVVSYFDPGALQVVAFATPELAARLVPGTGCRLVPEGGEAKLFGELGTIGGAWVPVPAALPERDMPGADLRRPLVLEPTERALLRPGMRLRVVFDDPRGSVLQRAARLVGQ